MVTQEVQKKEAIQTQSDRAEQFAEYYEILMTKLEIVLNTSITVSTSC
jgi:hypothetical protein